MPEERHQQLFHSNVQFFFPIVSLHSFLIFSPLQLVERWPVLMKQNFSFTMVLTSHCLKGKRVTQSKLSHRQCFSTWKRRRATLACQPRKARRCLQTPQVHLCLFSNVIAHKVSLILFPKLVFLNRVNTSKLLVSHREKGKD